MNEQGKRIINQINPLNSVHLYPMQFQLLNVNGHMAFKMGHLKLLVKVRLKCGQNNTLRLINSSKTTTSSLLMSFTSRQTAM